MEEKEQKVEKEANDDRSLIIIACLVFAVVIGLWLITLCTLEEEKETVRGTFGDMFGGVNALFSGLAFGGIIITILLQRKELSLQREELKESRAELKRAADAHTLSLDAFKRQAENLKISAKLSALNTLSNYYANFDDGSADGRLLAKYKAKLYIQQIEIILQNKDND